MEAQRDRARAAVKDDSWSTFGGARRRDRQGAGPPPSSSATSTTRPTPSCSPSFPRARGSPRLEAGQSGEIVLVTHAVLRRAGRPGRRHRRHRVGASARFVVEDTKIAAGRHHTHRRGRAWRVLGGRRGSRGDRRPAPGAHPPQPHRHPPAALGAAAGARRAREAGRLLRRSRPAALRLHAFRGDDARPARQGRAAGERQDLREPSRCAPTRRPSPRRGRPA